MRVLLVDPGGTERRHLAFGLRQAGFTVAECKDLSETADQVRRELPDMAVFVASSDGIESFTLADKLRTWNPEVMLFVASGVDGPDPDYLIGEYDADGHVLRPYQVEAVLQTMSEASGLDRYQDLKSGFFTKPDPSLLHVAK
jgi:DNA-binding response OmpR family regulator